MTAKKKYSRKPRPTCSRCGARKNDAGNCPYGCTTAPTPHKSLQIKQVAARKRERRAEHETKLGITPDQMREAALRAGAPALGRGFGIYSRPRP